MYDDFRDNPRRRKAIERFSREDVLLRPTRRDHAAHLYTDAQSLAQTLSLFIGAALARADGAIIIATPTHTERMLAGLRDAGHDREALAGSGRLTCIDAQACLAEIMDGDEPDREAFHSTIRGLIERAKGRFRGLCVYSELANLLWQQHNRPAALRIEQWWNDLIQEHGFALLCGYRLSAFDEGAYSGLAEICRAHSHLIPAADDERFDRAIFAALEELFPDGDAAGMRRMLADRCGHAARMPAGQAALFALQEMVPSTAQAVRARARAHYHRTG